MHLVVPEVEHPHITAADVPKAVPMSCKKYMFPYSNRLLVIISLTAILIATNNIQWKAAWYIGRSPVQVEVVKPPTSRSRVSLYGIGRITLYRFLRGTFFLPISPFSTMYLEREELVAPRFCHDVVHGGKALEFVLGHSSDMSLR